MAVTERKASEKNGCTPFSYNKTKNMRKIFLITFLCLFTNLWAWNTRRIEVDGIYYFIYNGSSDASVTYGDEKYKGSLVIPSTLYLNNILHVKGIDNRAFENCTELKDITIPSSVTSIDDDAFDGCDNLTDINVSEHSIFFTSVAGVLYNKEMTELIRYPGGKRNSSYVIPNTVTELGKNAFSYCRGLKDIIIPRSITDIGTSTFTGANLYNVYLYGQPKITPKLWGLHSEVNLYAHHSQIDLIKSKWSGRVLPIDPYFIEVVETYMTAIVIRLNKNEHSPLRGTITKITDGYNSEFIDNKDGTYTVTGLNPNREYYIDLCFTTEDGDVIDFYKSAKTAPCEMSLSLDDTTQTSLTLSNIKVPDGDKYASLEEFGIQINGKDYKYQGNPIKVTGLTPNYSYSIYPYAYYSGNKVLGESVVCSTLGVSPTFSNYIKGPTTYKCSGSYDIGNASLKKEFFTIDRKEYEGNSVIITGLEPNREYTVYYSVMTNEGSTETVSKTFTTPNITLTPLQPKGVSDKCSIVAASTNISEDETSVGFQWKKYDAPESLKPSEGYAAIYNGQLEGYIKNLQPTSYYNVRAFYKSAAEKYYYSDWVTFDPSDFSYFEPTVHTYEATNVTSSSVMVKGYVLAGTDNILEQGFEYWPVSKSESNAKRINAVPSNDVSTIFATGQVMTATIKDLKPNTTYSFHSFVKTNTGVTYGEEMMFTTDYDTTGIDSLTDNSSEVMVVDYHDINGRKLNKIGNGITIIRYSDGSVRKVIVAN